MSMHFVVTGGAGFIGSNLVDQLLAAGHSVSTLDNFDAFYDRSRKEDNLTNAARQPRFQLIEGDITNVEAVSRVFADRWPDVVIHLAAKAGVRPSIADPIGYGRVNIEGTLRFLEKAKERPTTRFIFASSSSVYGDRDDAPFRESDRVDDPISPYAATKKAGELLCHTYHHLHGLPVTCLRFFTVYGPRNRPDLAIAKFVRLIDHGEPVSIFGDGTSRRDYTFIGDIVDGIMRAAERCREYAVYNLGNSNPVDLSRLVELIAATLGKVPKFERLPAQPGDVRQTYADISLARKELGYSPTTRIEDGLQEYAQWYRNNPI